MAICDAIPDLIRRAQALLDDGDPEAAVEMFHDQIAAVDRRTPVVPDFLLLDGACTVLRGANARTHLLALLDNACQQGLSKPKLLAGLRMTYLIREGQIEQAAALIAEFLLNTVPDHIPAQVCLLLDHAPGRATKEALIEPYRARIEAAYIANLGTPPPADVEALTKGIVAALHTPGTPAHDAHKLHSQVRRLREGWPSRHIPRR